MTNDKIALFEQVTFLVKQEKLKEASELAEKEYPEGIYFDMPFDDYKKIPYFSRSFSQDILFDLEEARHSLKNPTQETKAMALGTAAHSMFLEPSDFKKTYVCEPNPEDFNKQIVLDKVADFKGILESVNERKSGSKDELIERARPYIDLEKYVIWQDVIDVFNAKISEPGKKALSIKDAEILEGMRKSCSIRDKIPEIIEEGRPEVAIFWKDAETGIMCKCLLDYVRAEAIGEVKTFTVTDKSRSLFEYLARMTDKRYYNYQFYVYQQALEIIINKINKGEAKIFGEYDEKWMKAFLKKPEKQFFIMYIRTEAPFQMKGMELERDSCESATSNAYYQVAKENWRLALSKFKYVLETEIWKEREIFTLKDSHSPGVMYQSGFVK